jgi:hypothetical protein
MALAEEKKGATGELGELSNLTKYGILVYSCKETKGLAERGPLSRDVILTAEAVGLSRYQPGKPR